MVFWKKKNKDKEKKSSPPQSSPKTSAAAQSSGRKIIAVGSGKGGVGKSTVSTNLALALAHKGLKVGLLDADIYGPSQPKLLGGAGDRATSENGVLRPTIKHGLPFVSMGLITGDEGPVLWRAPMAMKVLTQFLQQVEWGELDYLIIDLPPGTGDIQISLSQQADLTGAVIVTTPQEVAVGVAKKGLQMFQQVNVPILGVIENMSGFTCQHCQKESLIFSQGGGTQLAKEFNVPFLGKLPLSAELSRASDAGESLFESKDKAQQHLAQLMTQLATELEVSTVETLNSPQWALPQKVEINDDQSMDITWPDRHKSHHRPHTLRSKCPCASCVDEVTGKRKLAPGSIPLDISIGKVNRIGRYALSFQFSDGHSTGIYKFSFLREICECNKCVGQEQATFSV